MTTIKQTKGQTVSQNVVETGASAGGGPPRPFNPLVDITSATVLVWSRADSGVTLTSSKVSAWSDLSSNGYSWSQATAGNRPTITTANPSFNNKDTMTFVSPTFLSNIHTFGSIIDAEIFIVCSANTAAARGLFFGSISAPSGSLYPEAGGVTIAESFASTTTRTAISTARTLSSPQIYNVRSANASYVINITDEETYSSGTNTRAAIDTFQLGKNSTGTRFQGDVACVLLCQGILSAGDRTALKTFLKSTWGVV